MTDEEITSRYYSGTIYRTVSGLFGLFLACLGIYVVFFGIVELLYRVGAGSLIALLGANAVWAALHSRQSWLARLGPFF